MNLNETCPPTFVVSPSGLGVGLEGVDGRGPRLGVCQAGEVGCSCRVGSSDRPRGLGRVRGGREGSQEVADGERVEVSVRWAIHQQGSWKDGPWMGEGGQPGTGESHWRECFLGVEGSHGWPWESATEGVQGRRHCSRGQGLSPGHWELSRCMATVTGDRQRVKLGLELKPLSRGRNALGGR